jgi:hypothetical protein
VWVLRVDKRPLKTQRAEERYAAYLYHTTT